jgi:hypothetical protein
VHWHVVIYGRKPRNMKFYQGLYKPKNPEKYVGDVNKIVYRSGLELRFFRHFDKHPGIVKWASEEFYVPYLSPVDGRMHRYFVDLIVQTRDGTKIMIEIKPFSQTAQPKGKAGKRQLGAMRTWAVNDAKWKAAREFCKARKMQFQILTEKDLKEVR